MVNKKDITKEELFKELNKAQSDLISPSEVYLSSIAEKSIQLLDILKQWYKNDFLRTILDVQDDIQYQIDKEFDIYRERKGKQRENAYRNEKAKLKASLDRVLSPLRYEIQGHGEIDQEVLED